MIWPQAHNNVIGTLLSSRVFAFKTANSPKLKLAWFRNFHSKAIYTLVPTKSQKKKLNSHGFGRVKVWSRGVDTTLFKPSNPKKLDYLKPIMVYVGRIAVEKNIEAFLSLDMPVTILVIGDGAHLDMLKQHYPAAIFTGSKSGHDLASWLSSRDVFVFPSKTGTYGLVILEAMACGRLPRDRPSKYHPNGITGELNNDLKTAILNAIQLNPAPCIDYAQQTSWSRVTSGFACYLHNSRTYSLKHSLFEPDSPNGQLKI